MQAIILAAGMGKRLGELTSKNTKCMVKVLDKTLIERILEQLKECGIKKVIIVIGYKGENLSKFIGNNYNGLQIEYINNEDYYKTNNIYSLYLAKSYLSQEDTILLESDLIIDTSILKSLIVHPAQDLVTVAKFESWMDGTVVTIDENNHILSFVPKKKFDFSKINEYYKTVNIYKFSKEFANRHYIPFLEAYCKSMGDNEYYEEVLRVIAFLEKTNLHALVLENKQKWYEIDDIQDLQIAETLFSNDNDKLTRYYNRFGGYWRFPKLLDFCYLVNPFFPPENLRNEIISNFNILLEQYPSGQEVNRSLAAKIFGVKPSEIIVGNGAAEIINALIKNTRKITGFILPTFDEYINRIDNSLVKIFQPKNSNFSYTINELIEFSKDIEQLILINPDNPSGHFINKNDIFKLLDYFKANNKILILDESFVDFTDNNVANSLIESEILNIYQNLFVIKSISKSYGVPGIRLGIAASANMEMIEQTKRNLSIWNINSYGEFFMQIVDKYQKDYILACKKIAEERKCFYSQLEQINYLKPIPSHSNYFLCEVSIPIKAAELAKVLLNKYNILIKDCSNKKGFGKNEYVRIAIRSGEDNNFLISALKSLKF